MNDASNEPHLTRQRDSAMTDLGEKGVEAVHLLPLLNKGIVLQHTGKTSKIGRCSSHVLYCFGVVGG